MAIFLISVFITFLFCLYWISFSVVIKLSMKQIIAQLLFIDLGILFISWNLNSFQLFYSLSIVILLILISWNLFLRKQMDFNRPIRSQLIRWDSYLRNLQKQLEENQPICDKYKIIRGGIFEGRYDKDIYSLYDIKNDTIAIETIYGYTISNNYMYILGTAYTVIDLIEDEITTYDEIEKMTEQQIRMFLQLEMNRKRIVEC